MSFNNQPSLTGDVVTVEPLQSAHLEALTQAASNPRTWESHPASDRYKPDVFADYFEFLLHAGGTLLVRLIESGAVIGCSRYYVPPDQLNGIGIGFTFLDCAYWGGQVNFDLKRLMMAHALEHFPSVWFHIAPTNTRSQVATTRLGAEFAYDAQLELGKTTERWKCYELRRERWQAVLNERGVA